MTDSSEVAVRRSVEAIWRMEAARLIAGLARVTGSVGDAEDLAQDALVIALDQWPTSGIPPNPAGWLMTTARNRGVDQHRRRINHLHKLELIGRQSSRPEDVMAAEVEDRLDDHVGDDLLRLIFTAAHPALPMDSRVALTLRCLAGLSTTDIARAFLITEKAAAQRLVRAKRTLSEHHIAFALPDPPEMAERLASVLRVIYLIFNEGYSATSGENWMRPALVEEALRLGRVLSRLVPDEPEVHGLVALMEIQASRLPARTTPDGLPILLENQDRRRWDRLLIRRGLSALARGQSLPAPLGPYTLQAAIAACHARAASVETTDWTRITSLYESLLRVWPSPIVELNRAVAVSMSAGPAAGLRIVQTLTAGGRLHGYPYLPAVRGEMLSKLGRTTEAGQSFRDAAALTGNESERMLFRGAGRCTGGAGRSVGRGNRSQSGSAGQDLTATPPNVCIVEPATPHPLPRRPRCSVPPSSTKAMCSWAISSSSSMRSAPRRTG